MGDAADDLHEALDRASNEAEAMRSAGAQRCLLWPHSFSSECPVCHDLNWIDENGEPCEP